MVWVNSSGEIRGIEKLKSIRNMNKLAGGILRKQKPIEEYWIFQNKNYYTLL
jgi:hypothetical protein